MFSIDTVGEIHAVFCRHHSMQLEAENSYGMNEGNSTSSVMYVWYGRERFSTDFMLLFMFLYITHTCFVDYFSSLMIFPKIASYTNYFVLPFSTDVSWTPFSYILIVIVQVCIYIAYIKAALLKALHIFSKLFTMGAWFISSETQIYIPPLLCWAMM